MEETRLSDQKCTLNILSKTNKNKPIPRLVVVKLKNIKQESPTFLAPGTGFMEDGFSMNWLMVSG